MRGLCVWRNDRARRPWTHVALFDSQVLHATGLAIGVVAVELGAIAWIRNRYMDTPFYRRPSKSASGACWCSSPAFSSAVRDPLASHRRTSPVT